MREVKWTEFVQYHWKELSCGIIGIVVSVFMICVLLPGVVRAIRLRQGGVETKGYIIYVEDYGIPLRRLVRYRFMTHEGRWYIGEATMLRGGIAFRYKYRLGAPVTVTYLPSNPAYSWPDAVESEDVIGYMIAMLLWLGVGIMTLAILLHMVREAPR